MVVYNNVPLEQELLLSFVFDFGSKWCIARQKLEGENSEGPHIEFFVMAMTLDHFWG